MRKVCLLAVLSLVAAPALFAQTWREGGQPPRRPYWNRFELTPMIGYTWGGTIYADTTDLFRTDVDAASSGHYGINFGIPIGPTDMKLELMVDRQDTTLQGVYLPAGEYQTSSKFNGVALFGGSATTNFQVGTDPTDVLTVDLSGQVDTSALDITDNTTVTDAITATSTLRGALGAVQNRFEHAINNLNVAVENLSASESRIRDTDMASEMVNFTKSQILSQAGTAMLAQANQASQGVLQLLK